MYESVFLHTLYIFYSYWCFRIVLEFGLDILTYCDVLLFPSYAKCDDYIQEMERGTLQCAPGCTVEETLEAVMLSELSSIRELAAQACFRELHPTNAPLIMAQSGSKGMYAILCCPG